MTITRFRWWHIPAVMVIEEDLFGVEQWSTGMFWNELAAGHHYLVAVDDTDRVLGYAGLACTDPDEAWVQNIAVSRTAQRQGIGRALLVALLARADEVGARSTMLEVAADNGPAQQLYDSYGFEAVGVRRGYYQPSNTDAIVMRRPGRPA